jgi:hypothetical protein
MQSDLAYLQEKKEEEKVRLCGQFYLVSCSILLGWRMLDKLLHYVIVETLFIHLH